MLSIRCVRLPREVPPEGKDDNEVGLKELLNLVRIWTGCDLSHYKRHR